MNWPRVNDQNLVRQRDLAWEPQDTLGSQDVCWCGEPFNHEWPGKADGAEHPKEGDDVKERRDELTALLEQGAPYAPEQLRRIAELMELLYSDEKARPWWERAAEAGDRDAVDYLEVLKEEQETK
jgi:hypothetical protein